MNQVTISEEPQIQLLKAYHPDRIPDGTDFYFIDDDSHVVKFS